MKFLVTALLTAAAAISPLQAQAPDPQQILEGARLSATLVEMKEGLKGNLVQGRKKVPIVIFLKGKDIQFQFEENSKWRVFHMRLADDSYQLFEIIDGKTRDFPREKLLEPIAGTDLTYEDLALRFFYWPSPRLEGKESVGGQDCYKLRLDKPKGAAGRYEAVYVWVHTKFGAFMKIRGHNANGVLVKEFQVEDVMNVGNGVYVLEKMQVATHDSKTGRRASITDLTFSKPSSGALKGLR
ncbi:outer membrane lipoprotein-sorting protein [Akkermansiaceae bacterium]|nr:outer membrane lipoprotein-sorting protein [Akkermansiaceae bacterium]